MADMGQPDTTRATLDAFASNYWRCVHELDILRIRQWELHNLTLPQLRILFNVARRPGITINELAEVLGVTLSTTSGLVGKVVDRGLVSKRTDESDRRQVRLYMTEAGRNLAEQMAEIGDRFMAETATILGDELEAVSRALGLLAEATARARVASSEPEPVS